MENYGFCKTLSHHCVFVKKFGDNNFIILYLYMGDLLIVGQHVNKINNIKKQFSKSFAIKDLGPTTVVKVSYDRKTGKLCLSQEP